MKFHIFFLEDCQQHKEKTLFICNALRPSRVTKTIRIYSFQSKHFFCLGNAARVFFTFFHYNSFLLLLFGFILLLSWLRRQKIIFNCVLCVCECASYDTKYKVKYQKVSFGLHFSLLSSTFVFFHKLNVVENRSDFSVTVGRGAREEQIYD